MLALAVVTFKPFISNTALEAVRISKGRVLSVFRDADPIVTARPSFIFL
jgi:hypothetical protein